MYPEGRVAQYTDSMRIAPELLSPKTLQAVVQEFVTRDGTDDSSVERRIEAVMRQLDASIVELHFDDETETCNIVPAGDAEAG
jgi:uncharacterized protein YheU (UPF0270 family)